MKIFCILLLSSPLLADNHQEQSGYSPGGVYVTSSDQQLTGTLQTIMRTYGDRFQNVFVTVNRGHVTFTGVVISNEDKETLDQMTHKTPGLRGVNNQVQVQPQDNPPPSTGSAHPQ